ncbi:MAG TPA: hypothetical protein VGA78_06255 [Gemmatimonadales bacterium]
MLEFTLLVIAIICLAILVRPLWRRVTLPAWLVRARVRHRPGIPITSWLAALLLMDFIWLIGERRGVWGAIAWSIWVGAPLAATWVTWYWLRGGRTDGRAGGRTDGQADGRPDGL